MIATCAHPTRSDDHLSPHPSRPYRNLTTQPNCQATSLRHAPRLAARSEAEVGPQDLLRSAEVPAHLEGISCVRYEIAIEDLPDTSDAGFRPGPGWSTLTKLSPRPFSTKLVVLTAPGIPLKYPWFRCFPDRAEKNANSSCWRIIAASGPCVFSVMVFSVMRSWMTSSNRFARDRGEAHIGVEERWGSVKAPEVCRRVAEDVWPVPFGL